jgi:4-carboxymuconolactone decarboxylase
MKTGTIRKPKGLTTRVYYAVLVTALFTTGRRDDASEKIQEGMKSGRVPRRLFEELFVHLSLLLGFPTMLDGLARLRDISWANTPRRNKRIEREEEVTTRGRKALEKIYGMATNRLLANLASLHNIVPSMIVRDAYGRIISRPGMSLGEREIVNVVVLLIQKLDQQLFSHLRGALRVGVQPGALRDVVILAARVAGIDPGTPTKMLLFLTASSQSHR